MIEIIHFTRIGRMPTTVIEVVYSPENDGYYLSNTDFQNNKRRTSVKVYPTDAAAKADWNGGTVEWEPWGRPPSGEGGASADLQQSG
jgi:hypothetical protein